MDEQRVAVTDESPENAEEVPADEDVDGGASGADDHLADVEDGCGCTEVWEHLSEHRTED